jgi:hypothetical protein
MTCAAVIKPDARRRAEIDAAKAYYTADLASARRVLVFRLTMCSHLIESIFDTLKDQLGLERHHGRTVDGVGVRVAQRLLALTAAIWHGQPIARSLTAYDH